MIGMLLFFFLSVASTATSLRIQARTDYVKCAANSLFSCPTKSNCTPTTPENSSVICCPDGSDCRVIQPLVCDIDQQDVSKFPDNLVHTTNLTATLPTCGSGCCPLGYNCQNNICVLSYVPPPTPSSTSPPDPGPTSTSSTTSSATGGPATNTPQGEPQQESHLALALGLSLGLAGALAIILLVLWCLKRRKRAKAGYISQSYRNRGNPSVEDFMGTTPKPLQHELNPPGTPQYQPMHERKISGPISDHGDNAIHRSDFILGQRGSVQTGWERKEKPFWSRLSQDRPKSRLIPRSSRKSTNLDSNDPANGRVQVFNHPLRFGLPVRPNAAVTPDIGLARSPTGEEKLATLKDIGGRTVPSGAVVRVDNHTPPPSRAKKYEIRPRDRSESQRRPLVRDNSLPRQDQFDVDQSIEEATPQRGRSPPRGRAPSDATTASFETGSIEDEKESDSRRVTMNVMLPPASVFRTPPPTAREQRIRDDDVLDESEIKRHTTFDDMMRHAGSQRRR